MVNYQGWDDLANFSQRNQCNLWIYWHPINSDIVEIHIYASKSTFTTEWSLPRSISRMRTTWFLICGFSPCVSFPLLWLNTQECTYVRKVYLVHTSGGLGLKLGDPWWPIAMHLSWVSDGNRGNAWQNKSLTSWPGSKSKKRRPRSHSRAFP